MEQSNVCETNLKKDVDAVKINELYEDCLNYLKSIKGHDATSDTNDGSGIMIKMENQNEPNGRCNVQDQVYEMFEERSESFVYEEPKSIYNVENEMSSEPAMDDNSIKDHSSERLRKLSAQLPKIIITQSDPNLDKELIYKNSEGKIYEEFKNVRKPERKLGKCCRSPYSEYPRRLVSKDGTENVAHISNIPYEKIRLLNDSFHTLINLRWRWIVIGTILVHFAIWFVFAVFWYITALAHYDFEPDPPKKACVTGGKDFVTIFLASVEAQTTIGFGDRTIDEECPESIFLFVMQLILGTGLSGVLTCVVYAKLTRPEKLSRDGVGFSKKAAISTRDGKLCLMFRAWDLNYDHIIGSEFSAHFVKTHRTKEGEVIRYYTRSLELQQREFLLWPVTLVHVIDEKSPLYKMTPEQFMSTSYEITVSLKGASASMGTFTQSQTSYLPREVMWGYRFPSVVSYDRRKQKYVIDHKKLNFMEQVDTPLCSGNQLSKSFDYPDSNNPTRPGSPGSFSKQLNDFHLQRTSSFKHNKKESKV